MQMRRFRLNDWDDVQFSEIVCRRPKGSHLIVPTGLHPTQGQYQEPPLDRFEIRDLGKLQPATELHLSAVKSRSERVPVAHFLAGLGLLSPLFFWLAARVRGAGPPPLPDRRAGGVSRVRSEASRGEGASLYEKSRRGRRDPEDRKSEGRGCACCAPDMRFSA